MDAQRQNERIRIYRDGLLDDTLPFWLKHCVELQKEAKLRGFLDFRTVPECGEKD